MPTLDERLRELAGDTHSLLDPSPELLYRIRSATTHQSRRRIWARPAMAVAAAAAVAVALLGLSVWPPHGTDRTARVVTQPMTRTGFNAQAGQACSYFAAAVNQSAVVTTTPDLRGVAATVLFGATQRLLDDVDLGMDLSPKGRYRLAPPDARPVLVAVNIDLRGALDQLRAVQSQTAAGHTSAAQSALDAFHALTREAAARLANYGAQECAPLSQP